MLTHVLHGHAPARGLAARAHAVILLPPLTASMLALRLTLAVTAKQGAQAAGPPVRTRLLLATNRRTMSTAAAAAEAGQQHATAEAAAAAVPPAAVAAAAAPPFDFAACIPRFLHWVDFCNSGAAAAAADEFLLLTVGGSAVGFLKPR